VVGGLAGKAAAQTINPTIEAKFWQESHASQPYARNAFGFDEYAPAYRYGWESFGRHGGQDRTFESVEKDLDQGWAQAKGRLAPGVGPGQGGDTQRLESGAARGPWRSGPRRLTARWRSVPHQSVDRTRRRLARADASD
jgi:hypothetical protein